MGHLSPRPLLLLFALSLASPLVAQERPRGTVGPAPEVEAAAQRLRDTNVESDHLLGNLDGRPHAVAPALEPRDDGAGKLAVTQPDWPVAPTVKPWLEVPIQAIFLSDDNGGHPCSITPNQVEDWVIRANQIWADAHIRFLFDPAVGSTDYFSVKSTLLNEMTGDAADPNWPSALSLGNNYAAIFPDRLTMFFRYGNEAAPTGGGFSWSSMGFVAMPGFPVTGVCGVQNIGLMAHEIGHYLGLPHTFPAEFPSVASAEAFYTAGGTGPTNDVFNADGRDHTEDDPYIDIPAYQCDTATTSVTLAGKVFDLPKDNVMTYYHPISEVTETQYLTSRQAWAVRAGLPMHELILGGVTTYEGEHLGGAISGGWWTNQALGSTLGLWSNGSQVLWLDASIGDTMSLNFPAGGGGTYDIYVGLTAADDYCIVEPSINGTATPQVNLYSKLVLPTGPVYLGTHTLPFGTSTLGLKAVANDVRCANQRQGVGVDYIVLAAAAQPGLEISRVGFPPNADVLEPGAFGAPRVGGIWSPSVNHQSFVTDAVVDVLAVSGGTANWPLGLEGTLLVDLAQVLSYHARTPGVIYWFPIPLDASFIGLQVHTQAGSLSVQNYFKLTNALDVTIGSY